MIKSIKTMTVKKMTFLKWGLMGWMDLSSLTTPDSLCPPPPLVFVSRRWSKTPSRSASSPVRRTPPAPPAPSPSARSPRRSSSGETPTRSLGNTWEMTNSSPVRLCGRKAGACGSVDFRDFFLCRFCHFLFGKCHHVDVLSVCLF